jgi:hypothetical protein
LKNAEDSGASLTAGLFRQIFGKGFEMKGGIAKVPPI